MSVVDVLAKGVRKEAQNLKSFVTTPSGPFQTVDKMVVDARRTVREVAESVGVRPRFMGQRRLRRLFRR